jgi:ubiquinone/menaquinone biosynthesis C-methylase UbiE
LDIVCSIESYKHNEISGKIVTRGITTRQPEKKESETKRFMGQTTPADTKQATITNHSIFAALYERLSRSGPEKSSMWPLRKEIIAQAQGIVLEIGAGTGLNFALYDPEHVERVEAVEPDNAMLRYARERLKTASVPITLTQAPVEALPFADETFDSAVATLVFCSVSDPVRGLSEIRRVLKAGGALLLVEHVQAQGAFAQRLQDIITPVTKRLAGNCHWNRDTERSVINANFEIESRRDASGGLQRVVVVKATR